MNNLLNNEIHVYGIQRTGQHAIISWLIGHFDEAGFKNCMTSAGERRSQTGIEPPYWYFNKGNLDWEESNEFRNIDNFIFGTEFSMGRFALNPNLNDQKLNIASSFSKDVFSKNRYNLMVIRNPYNHYASIISWRFNSRLRPPGKFTSYWKEYAKLFLGEPGGLPGNRIGVVFDKWFEDKQYRMKISELLNIPFSDSRLNVVMKIGYKNSWGSSFDKMNLKQEAQKMDVLNRKNQIPADKERYYKEILKDKELKQIWKEVNAKSIY